MLEQNKSNVNPTAQGQSSTFIHEISPKASRTPIYEEVVLEKSFALKIKFVGVISLVAPGILSQSATMTLFTHRHFLQIQT